MKNSEQDTIKLIVLSGLPCTGKSSVADALGHQLGIPVFSRDWLSATLRRSGLSKNHSEQLLGYTAYEILTTLAQRQLSLGQSAILDSVVGMESTRRSWRNLAAAYRAKWAVIECICSDEHLHRTRLASRRHSIPGRIPMEWFEIERVKIHFEPWQDERLILDTVHPLEKNIMDALDYIVGAHTRPGQTKAGI